MPREAPSRGRPGGPHQALGEGRRSHRQPIASVQRIGEHFPARVVVDVVAIEETDDDPGVEVDQSRRNAATWITRD
jgi:hypothetical protein